MSFQGLISGSECAAPANPLSQVLKHTEADRSLQQVRLSLPELGEGLTCFRTEYLVHHLHE